MSTEPKAPAALLDHPAYKHMVSVRQAENNARHEAERRRAARRRRGLRRGGNNDERRARALLEARCSLMPEIYGEQGGAHTACLRLAKWCFELRDFLPRGEIERAVIDTCLPVLQSAGSRTGEASRNRSHAKALHELQGYKTAILPTAWKTSQAKAMPPERMVSAVARAVTEATSQPPTAPVSAAIEKACASVFRPAHATPSPNKRRRILDINQPYFTQLPGDSWSDAWEDTFKWYFASMPPRILGLNGEKKTGKTLFLEKAVAQTKANFKASLSIVGRRTLAYNSAPRLGLENYLDHKGEIKARDVVICLDSIHRIAITDDKGNARRFGLVVIDEVEQLSRHLFGATIGKRSCPVFDRFSIILRNAEHIIIADADLADTGWEMVRRALGRDPNAYHDDELEIRNAHIDAERTDVYFDSKDQAIVAILEAIRAGQKVAVPCTYRRQAHAIDIVCEKYIEGEGILREDEESVSAIIESAKAIRPGLRHLVVTSRTTSEPKVKAFLADPNAWLKDNPLDLLVYSPTLGTGVSIEVPFDRLIGIMHAGIHTTQDIMQQMARVRTVSRWEMWVEPKELQLTTERDAIERAYVNDIRRALWLCERYGLREGLDEQGQIKLRPTNPDHWQLFLSVETARREHTVSLLRGCVAYSHSRGIRVEHCPDTLDISTRTDVQIALAIGGIHADEDEVAAIFSAPRVSWGEAKAILERGARTRLEELSVSQARIRHHLAREVSDDDIRLDVVDRMVSKTRRLARVRHIMDAATNDAAQLKAWLDDIIKAPDWDAGGDELLDFYAAHTPDVIRHRALAKVLWLADIHLEHLEGVTPYEMDHATLLARRWPERIRKYAETLEQARWGLTIPKDLASSPMRYLKRVCAAIGFDLRCVAQPRVSGHASARVRVYAFEQEQQALAWSWSESERRRLAGETVENPDAPPQSPWPEDCQAVAQTCDNTNIDRTSVPPPEPEPERGLEPSQHLLPLRTASGIGASVTRSGHAPTGPP